MRTETHYIRRTRALGWSCRWALYIKYPYDMPRICQYFTFKRSAVKYSVMLAGSSMNLTSSVEDPNLGLVRKYTTFY
jgi:hypothetical protein